MSIKKKMNIKLFIVKEEKFNFDVVIEDVNDKTNKKEFVCFNEENIDDLILEINNSFIYNKKIKYAIDLYVVSDSMFYYNCLLPTNKKKKNISWVKEIISKEVTDQLNDYEIKVLNENNVLIINKCVNDLLELFINKLSNCNLLEIENVYFNHNFNSFLLNENIKYNLIIVNYISDKYYVSFYEMNDKMITNYYLGVFDRYEMVRKNLLMMTDTRKDNYFYIDELFYESTMNKIKLDFCMNNFYFLNEGNVSEIN